MSAPDPLHLPEDVVTDGATCEPSRSRVRLRCWVALALAAVSLVACGGADGGVDPGAGGSTVDPQPRPDELAGHEGRPCPEQLLEPEAGVIDPAPASPELAEAGLAQPDRMWVCDYALVETPRTPDSDGAIDPGWRLRTSAVPVPDAQRERLLDDVTVLEPADPQQACTMDLGPRRMLVLSTDGDLTGVVVDDFGCHAVRMTDDPHATVPGETTSAGTVPGVLTGPEGLTGRVAALVR